MQSINILSESFFCQRGGYNESKGDCLSIYDRDTYCRIFRGDILVMVGLRGVTYLCMVADGHNDTATPASQDNHSANP